jgi:hypothetical protein
MKNVAIHLRQGYGGQDVKMLPVPVFNTNWEDCPTRLGVK